MVDLAKKEKKILKFWQTNKIFAKSIEQRKGRPVFSFYDGPPFATGKPHYGHILPTAIKDTILRYQAMRGYQVPRRVGWDCHGLPVENLVEKELGIKDKKDIEKDIVRFNSACRSSVFRCVKDFQNTLEKVGRWADYDNAYATLDNDYIESVWWVFSKLWDQGLVYKGYRVTPYCPRCGTALSNFEVNLGYRDIEEESVYIKFKVVSDVILNPDDSRGEESRGKSTGSFANAQDDKNKYARNDNTYFLVWTTTPWTLPANVALAVNPDQDYAEVKAGDEILILANQRLSELGKEYQILKQLKGKDLLGLKYQPLYNFRKLDKKSHYVIAGDFVSMEDGTGIVHIAPAFGEEDMQLGKQNDLPIVLNVNLDGTFSDEVKPWAGLKVKEADPKIIEDLKQKNLLYKTARTTHAYPFCWRCESPLLYYALDSWYVAVTKFKDQLIKNNRSIHWVPNHLKYGRFGKWLEGVKDWSISRSRFWGAPIPIWQCSKCNKIKVISDRIQIAEKTGLYNILYLTRHAQAKNNLLSINDCKITSKKCPLSAKGKKDVLALAKKLKQEKIDLIYSSPNLRARQTAEILAAKLNTPVIIDNNLKEYQSGKYDGLPTSALGDLFRDKSEWISKKIPGVETLKDARRRMEKFVKAINEKHKGKKILVISHGHPLWMLKGYLAGVDIEKSIYLPYFDHAMPFKMLDRFVDLHKPYIDEIKLKCDCGGLMERIIDVFDCWFESGSMPYSQWHYPFENKDFVEETFPANFISEGIDQTRGWFYTLHVLAAALTLKDIGLGKNQPAFRNVVVNGLILDPQGKKLSKKLGNYIDPQIVFSKYGADALRYFMLASTPMGEDYKVSEKAIEEVWRRVISTLYNTYIFFDSYLPKDFKINFNRLPKTKVLLDRWILSLFNQLNDELVQYLNDYELVKACRLFDSFIDDLSNWYVRRSRARFQKQQLDADKKQAASVYGYVLFNLCKLMAPFTPFIAEEIYLNLAQRSSGKLPLSVHLCDYPKPNQKAVSKTLNQQMAQVRQLTASGLAQRAQNGIKVRQPLAKAEIKLKNFNKAMISLVAEELNVKEVKINSKLSSDIELDLKITSVLKEEGAIRDLIRQIQGARKDAKLKPQHKIYIRYSTSVQGHKIIDKWQKEIKEQARAEKMEAGQKKKERFLVEKEITIGQQKIWLGIKRI